MIQKIGFLHYLSEASYKDVCHRYDLDAETHQGRDNWRTFENGKIAKIHLYNLEYEQFGRIWFMHVDLDYAKFDCTYDTFPEKLNEAYHAFFGGDIMQNAPDYDGLNCDYVEYYTVFAVDDASAVMERLRKKCPVEQTEKALWHSFTKPNATIAFCLAKQDDSHIETLARCHGPALKKRIQDTALHRGTGVTPSAIVNAETEKEITDWLWRRYV